jgi:hypothetical protein
MIARAIFAAAVLCAVPMSAGAAAYYVDCAAGNDAAEGLSPATAWGTLAAAHTIRIEAA